MQRVFLFVLVSVLAVSTTNAQLKNGFASNNYVGLLEGDDGSAFQVQTINGYRFKGWFAGIGLGLDYYKIRSVPLFVSMKKDFSLKNRGFYVTLDGGTSFAWVKDDNQNRWDSYISREWQPRLFWGSGLGYRLGLKNRDAVLLNLGYSFKRMHEVREIPTMCLNPPCPTTEEKYDYQLKRVSLRLGYEF